MGDATHVDDIAPRFDQFDWLTVDQTTDGSWLVLYAPGISPPKASVERFWALMDRAMDACDLDHVTEIANGWVILKDSDSTDGREGSPDGE